MTVTNNYGHVVGCTICRSQNLKGYKPFTPAFASSIDSIYIGWCADHEREGLQEYQKCVEEKDRLLQGGSGS